MEEGGNTALYVGYTVDAVDTFFTVDIVNTVDTEEFVSWIDGWERRVIPFRLLRLSRV